MPGRPKTQGHGWGIPLYEYNCDFMVMIAILITINIVSDGPGYPEGSAPPQHSLQRQESMDRRHYPHDVQVSL